MGSSTVFRFFGKLFFFVWLSNWLMKKIYTANDLSELPPIAQALLPLVHQCKTVALVGEMGAGKTTLIKALCTALGVQDATSSPTFALVNEYAAPMAPIYHLDLYRLQSEEEAISVGLLELFDGEKYCFIEWPDLVAGYLPASTLWIQVLALEQQQRQITAVLEAE